MTKYIGIDQSYRSSGIVVVDAKGDMTHHEIISSSTADGDYFARARMVAEEISASCLRIASGGSHNHIIGKADVKIGLEGLAFGMRGHTLQNLAGLQFLIVSELRKRDMDVTIFTPSKVKKFATGNGRAKKPDMFVALPDEIKASFKGVTKAAGREDLTDAYFIAQLIRTV